MGKKGKKGNKTPKNLKVFFGVGAQENWALHHMAGGAHKDKRHRREDRKSWQREVEE